MNFQMLYRPTSIVFVDDDVDYLEMMAMALPRAWSVELYARPQTCIERLLADAAQWERDALVHQSWVESWRIEERALLPQILDGWGASIRECSLAGLNFVDYAMPGINGLEMLAQLQTWPGSRVLLTGQADEHLAIEAFNQGLIRQYVPKQHSQVRERLIALAQEARCGRQMRYEQIWLSTLTPKQYQLLNHPLAQNLMRWAQEQWTHYLCLGQPFGILGQTAAGQMQWLQLETPERFAELAQLLEIEAIPAEQCKAVLEGVLLPDLDLRLDLNCCEDALRFASVQVWEKNGCSIHGACFDLPQRFQPAVKPQKDHSRSIIL